MAEFDSTDSGMERGQRYISPMRDESGISSYSSSLEDPFLIRREFVEDPAPAAVEDERPASPLLFPDEAEEVGKISWIFESFLFFILIS